MEHTLYENQHAERKASGAEQPNALVVSNQQHSSFTDSATPQSSRAERKHAFYLRMKRLSDILITASLLVVLSPLFLAVAILILLEGGAPILYYQYRTGQHGRPFRFYKFRSMVPNAEALKSQLESQNEATGPIFKMKNDPRVTRIGRWLRRYSIDELPQLINVLRGEMSIVGPRPLPVREAAACTDKQWQRHSIQPGLLCFREVLGRSRLTFEEWMDLDLIYLKKQSVGVDMQILKKALSAVLQGDGAC